MFCKYCGKEQPDSVKFCSKCGKMIALKENNNVVQEPQQEQSPKVFEEEVRDSKKICKHCGNEVLETVRFCPKCGKEISKNEPVEKENCVTETTIEAEPLNEKLDTTAQGDEVLQESASPKETKFCKFCGKEIALTAMFCPKCGKKIAEPAKQSDSKQKPKANNNAAPNFSAGSNHKNGKKFTAKNLFIQVFKKHSAEERDKILKAGFSDEIPKNPKVTPESLQPWFYSRVFFILLAVFIVFEICLLSFNNSNMMPGVMLIGSLMMPFAILTMYFELNVYKDISFYKTIGIFLLGGAISLLFTLFLYAILPEPGGYDFFSASLISIIEEIGKALIVILILKRTKNASVLHGLLIGGAIGCGFAVFESAGYAFNVFLDAHDYNTRVDLINDIYTYSQYGYTDSIGAMNFNIFLRSILSFGGHTAWAAISGAAFAKTKKINREFLKPFGICLILHALWDTDTAFAYLKLAILCYVAWKVIIKQITEFVDKSGTN